MKQLNKLQSTLFVMGGVLMVVGAGCYAFMYVQEVACWIYLLGAVLFAFMQISQTYEGNNFTVKRLKRIMSLADFFFIFSGMLMVDSAYQLLRDAFTDYTSYNCHNKYYHKYYWFYHFFAHICALLSYHNHQNLLYLRNLHRLLLIHKI